MNTLTTAQLDALKAIDTPTICNAIERFKVRNDVTGFTGMNIRCLYPQFGVTIGYALTVTVDSPPPMSNAMIKPGRIGRGPWPPRRNQYSWSSRM